MNNDLDIYKEYTPPQGDGSDYLKLKDGDSFKLRLVSLPIVYSSSYTNQESNETKVSTRYAYVVWNHDENRAQVWGSINAATYGQISELVKDEDFGDHREYDVKVSRTGSGASDTRYSVRPGVKRYALTPDQIKSCSELDAIDKVSKGKGVSSVMWLADYHKAKEAAERRKNGLEDESGNETPGYAAAKAPALDIAAKKQMDDFGGEPINMDDIPF